MPKDSHLYINEIRVSHISYDISNLLNEAILAERIRDSYQR